MIYILNILIVVEILFIFLFIKKSTQSRMKNIFNKPINFIFLSILFIHFIVPLIMQYNSFYRYQNNYLFKTHLIANILSVSCLFFLYAGYSFFNKNISINYKITIIKKNKLFFSFLFITLPAIYFSYNYFSFLNTEGLELYFRDRIGYGRGRGIQVSIINNLYVGLLIILSKLLWDKRNKFKINYSYSFFFILLLLYTLGYYLTLGSRNSVLIVVLCSFYIYILIVKKVNVRRILLYISLISFLFVLLSYIGLYRASPNKTYIELYNENPLIPVLVYGLNSGYGNHENLLFLIENNDRLNKSYGLTYLAAITNFVPRSIWKDKPFGGGPLLKNTIYPGTYVAGKKGNSSLTTGLITEAYLNFGLYGVMIISFIFGVILAIIKNYYSKIKIINIIELVSMIIIVVSFCFMLIYMEFLGLFARTIMCIVPLYLINKIMK